MAPDVFDFSDSVVHLGDDSTAVPIPDWTWDPAQLAEYEGALASPGDARLVSVFAQPATWRTWERHPAGEEVVVLLSGRVDLILELDGSTRRVELTPGCFTVVPRNTWHTADVHEPGEGLFITPGVGTEHRPR